MFGFDDIAMALPALKGLGGGGSTKTTVSNANNVSISNNPTIANLFGDSGSISPNVTGGATGLPSASATSSDSGSNPFGYLPGGTPGTPYRPNTGYVYGPQGQPVGLASTSGDSTLPLLLAGGAALLFLFNNES